MKNILLAGYYGFGNLGDEAILEMFLKQIKSSSNIDKITVLSGNPTETHKKYDVDAIDRYSIYTVIKKLKKSDALVFGGGSLLQDVTSKRSIYYYLFLIKIAKLLGKKVIMLSQGIGPIVNKTNFNNTAKVLRKVDFITVRDIKSQEILYKMGLDDKKVAFSADPVINLNSNDLTNDSNDEKIKICFSLRNWKDTNLVDQICRLVSKLQKDNIECYFVPFYYNMDIELINELEQKLDNSAHFIKQRLTTKEAVDIIKKMDLLIGIRLHALIFAAAVGTPFIGISYDPKIDEFMKSLDMRVFSDTDSLDSDELYEEIMAKLDNRDKESEKLKANVKKLKETLNVNLDIIQKI